MPTATTSLIRNMKDLFSLYDNCTLCPRECGARRTLGEKGVCGENAVLHAARAAKHMWEEPAISGSAGSGAVFFSGCPLKCLFCQNSEISQDCKGFELDATDLSRIIVELQQSGAHNINLVTAGHFIPHIVTALEHSRMSGLKIPIVFNTGGYEKAESLRLLSGLVDVYLPDFKYLSPELSARFSGAANYPDFAKAALAEMVRQTGVPEIENDLLVRGVMVRLLVLPGHTHEAMRILDYLFSTYQNDIFYSIMGQYTPPPAPLAATELNRRLNRREYERVVEHAIGLGIKNAFYQQLSSADSGFIPGFDGTGIIK